jgi:hypothetical protein
VMAGALAAWCQECAEVAARCFAPNGDKVTRA